jgi:tetratricopeptide (TPR) repeat protein
MTRVWLTAVVLAIACGAAPVAAQAPSAAPAPTAAPTPAPASPERERARELLIQGDRKLQDGALLEALALFKEAYQVFPSPKIAFNLAQTCFELGRSLEALSHYEAFLRDVKEAESPQQWRLAYERAFKLQGEIATVHLQTNVVATVVVDGEPRGETPLKQPIRLLPGHHVILLTRPGYDRQVLELKLAAGDAVTRREKLLTAAEAAATRRAVQQAEAERRAAQALLQRAQADESRRRVRTRRLVRGSGWAAVAVGTALAAAGVTCWGLSSKESSKVTNAKEGVAWSSLAASDSRAATYRNAAYSTLGLGLAHVAAGAVLLGVFRRGEQRGPAPGVTALVTGGPDHAGLVVRGSF